jgi:hypothetical protein
MNHELFNNSVTAVFRDQEIFVTEKGLKKQLATICQWKESGGPESLKPR